MKESIYLETTVVSYYTSKPSRDIIALAHQEITRQWWPIAMRRYNVFISEVVIEEAGFGDPEAAKRRLEELKDFPHLELNDKVEKMAQVYMERLEIPEKSFRDAAHLAVACVHNVDYLVTWNCTHLANGEVIKKLMKINESFIIHTPIICTPEELMEE
ncbi:MAG: type II toxin-antitoxin system VapC family toxin [Methanomicrobia archaeon]|nr:type II toxin-antitoxin system VapC family toxin [Methanomicrobia archaeon]